MTENHVKIIAKTGKKLLLEFHRGVGYPRAICIVRIFGCRSCLVLFGRVKIQNFLIFVKIMSKSQAMAHSAIAKFTPETMTVTMLMAMLTDRAAHSAALLIEQLSKSLPAASPLQLLNSKCFSNSCFNQSSEDTG